MSFFGRLLRGKGLSQVSLILPVLLLTGLSIWGFFWPKVLLAATGLTIQPVKISQTVAPTNISQGAIKLSNASDEEVVVEMAVEDFIPSAGDNGINFVGRATGVTSVRDWITINSPNQFIFKRGETKDVGYTITVPQDAEPGSHFGVIFFKAIKKSDAEQQLKIGTQVGVLVFLTVPGDYRQTGRVLSFTVPKFLKTGPVPLTIRFENTGTVHFEPKGMITVKNIFGTVVGMVPVEGQAVLPTGVKNLDFTWQPDGFILGRYRAAIQIFDPAGQEIATAETAFYAAPIWYLLSFVLIFILIFSLINFLKSRVKISFTSGKDE